MYVCLHFSHIVIRENYDDVVNDSFWKKKKKWNPLQSNSVNSENKIFGKYQASISISLTTG